MKAFIEEAIGGFMRGERDDFGDYLAPDIVFHTPRLTSETDHAAGLHAEVQAYARLLANTSLTVDFVIAEDDFVAIHMTSSARYSQSFATDPGSLLPTGEVVETGGMAILRVRDDKITDVWYYSKHREVMESGAPS